MKILLADDHAMFRAGLRRVITDELPQAQIDECSSCLEIMEKVKKEVWDILILDISMGEQSSLAFLPEIKKLAPRTPIMMLSMYTDRQFIVRSLRSGASGYLTKEHTTSELIHGMKALLSGKRYLSESVAQYLADFMALGSSEEPHDTLSSREFEVFKLIASGRSVSEIAGILYLSTKTVSTYRTRILEKMELRSNGELMRYAMQHGLIG